MSCRLGEEIEKQGWRRLDVVCRLTSAISGRDFGAELRGKSRIKNIRGVEVWGVWSSCLGHSFILRAFLFGDT
jgi:hypothetical protein